VSATFDLLVVGDVNPDVILADAPGQLAFGQTEQLAGHGTVTLGGSAGIAAAGAARLGLRTAVAAAVGDDAGGRLALEELRRRGVDTSAVRVLPGEATGLTVHLVRGDDRAMITARGTMDALGAADVPRGLIAASRHVHAASFYLLPRLRGGLRDLFDLAHLGEATTSLDLNWDPDERWDGLADVLPAVDVLFTNAAEAAGVTGASDPGVAVTVLAARGPLPVVKLGAAGALTHDGCRLVHVRAAAADVTDTVGAGDSLDAGFLCGRLDGWDAGRSLELGVACGTLSTRAAGGVQGQPDRAEAEAAMEGLLPGGPAATKCGR